MSGGSTLQCEQDIQKLEKYLPLLENLVHYVNLVSDNPRMVLWTSDLKIRWSSALTSSSFFIYKGQKFFQIDSLLFELSMVLFLYRTLLQEWASEILSKDLVQSVEKAAGVYRYLAYEVLPSLQPQERPPEATLSLASAMSLICLEEAQAVTVRKAEEKGTAGSLLAKLHYGVVQILDEATNKHFRPGVNLDRYTQFKWFNNGKHKECPQILHHTSVPSKTISYISAIITNCQGYRCCDRNSMGRSCLQLDALHVGKPWEFQIGGEHKAIGSKNCSKRCSIWETKFIIGS